MDPNTWFNLSRLSTIIGGILTVIGGFGLYHFGKLKDDKNELEKGELKGKVESAKATAATANQKTKELEVEVANAQKETAKANEKAESFRLSIQQANLKAQNAKLKTEELTLEVAKANAVAEQAKLERERLIKQQKYIKTIQVEIKARVPTKSSETSTAFNRLVNEKEKMAILAIIKPDQTTPAFFLLTSYTNQQIKSDLREITLNYANPEMQNNIIGKEVSILDGELTLDCHWDLIISKYKDFFLENATSEIEVNLLINGIKAQRIIMREPKPNQFIGKELRFKLRKEANTIVKNIIGMK